MSSNVTFSYTGVRYMKAGIAPKSDADCPQKYNKIQEAKKDKVKALLAKSKFHRGEASA